MFDKEGKGFITILDVQRVLEVTFHLLKKTKTKFPGMILIVFFNPGICVVFFPFHILYRVSTFKLMKVHSMRF